MFRECIALERGTINHQAFNEKLAIHKHSFITNLHSQVQPLLPNQILPKIGTGYNSDCQ